MRKITVKLNNAFVHCFMPNLHRISIQVLSEKFSLECVRISHFLMRFFKWFQIKNHENLSLSHQPHENMRKGGDQAKCFSHQTLSQNPSKMLQIRYTWDFF